MKNLNTAPATENLEHADGTLGWRPNGKNPDAYVGWERWSVNQWHWEFLRRNEKFQLLCREAVGISSDGRWEAELITARLFGLKSFKHYEFPYESKYSPPPEFELLHELFVGPDIGHKVFTTKAYQGDVIVKFNVQHAFKNLRHITQHVTWYENLLKQELMRIETMQRRAAEPLNESRDTDIQLSQIRLLDGFHSGLKLHEISAIVFSDKNKSYPDEWREVAKKPLRQARERVKRYEI